MNETFKFPQNQKAIDSHIHIGNWKTGGNTGYDDYFESYILDVKDYIERIDEMLHRKDVLLD